MGGMSGDILYQISLETYRRNSTALIRWTCSSWAPINIIKTEGGRHALHAIIDMYSVDIQVVGSRYEDNAV